MVTNPSFSICSDRDLPKNEDDDPDCLIPAIPEDTPHIPYQPQRKSDEEVLQRSREYYELMAKRRTVRRFSEEAIPQEVLDNIVKTAGKNLCIFLTILRNHRLDWKVLVDRPIRNFFLFQLINQTC